MLTVGTNAVIGDGGGLDTCALDTEAVGRVNPEDIGGAPVDPVAGGKVTWGDTVLRTCRTVGTGGATARPLMVATAIGALVPLSPDGTVDDAGVNAVEDATQPISAAAAGVSGVAAPAVPVAAEPVLPDVVPTLDDGVVLPAGVPAVPPVLLAEDPLLTVVDPRLPPLAETVLTGPPPERPVPVAVLPPLDPAVQPPRAVPAAVETAESVMAAVVDGPVVLLVPSLLDGDPLVALPGVPSAWAMPVPLTTAAPSPSATAPVPSH